MLEINEPQSIYNAANTDLYTMSLSSGRMMRSLCILLFNLFFIFDSSRLSIRKIDL